MPAQSRIRSVALPMALLLLAGGCDLWPRSNPFDDDCTGACDKGTGAQDQGTDRPGGDLRTDAEAGLVDQAAEGRGHDTSVAPGDGDLALDGATISCPSKCSTHADMGGCVVKPGFCLIDGTCYGKGDLRASTLPCWVCDPGFRQRLWAPAKGCVITLADSLTKNQLSGPSGVTVSASNKVYLTDQGNKRVAVISDGALQTLAGYKGDVYDVAVDSTDTAYVATAAAIQVFKAGTLSTSIPVPPLHEVKRVALDRNGTLWATSNNSTHAEVLKISVSSKPLFTSASKTIKSATNEYDGLDVVIDQLFNQAWIFVANYKGNKLLILRDQSSPKTAVVNDVMDAAAYIDSKGVSVVYTVNGGTNSTLSRVSPTTGKVEPIWAGSGNGALKDGPRKSAKFNNPLGVATDSKGYVFVADSGNNAIRVINPVDP